MKKIKAIIVLLVVLMGVVFLPACFWKEESQPETNEIVFADEYDIPNVIIGKEYDFEPYFTKQKDTAYAMTATYLDDDLNEISLEVDGFKFVQNEMSNVFVTITATKGSTTYSGEIELPIDTTADDTDFWVYDSLYAGTGMTKSINYYTQYRKGEDSLTSVKFTYKGVAKKNSPISAIPFIDWPSNSRLTVTDWSNAVIVFDVYNSSEKNITLGFIIKHSSGISYSFDQCQKFVCEPNKWTRIEYSLKSLNLTEEFVFDPKFELGDHIIAQVVYDGAPEANAEDSKAYSYNFFVDNVDICNYSESRFPNLDTTTYKEYEDFFTKDDALSLIVNYDYENSKKTEDLYCYDKLVEYSNKSIKVVLSENGESAQAFLHSFIGGNPMGWKPLDISNAVMSFYISVKNADKTFDLRFESDDNIFADPITIDLTQASGEGWTVEEVEDGWYKVTVTVSETNAENALVRMDFIRTMRLYFTNQTATQGEESAIYLDSLVLSGHKITEILGDEKLSWETKSPYTSQEDSDMFSNDDNLVLTVNGDRIEKDEVANIYDASTKSNYSYRLILSETGENTATATVDSFFTGTPSNWTILDISNATITFDLKVINANTVFSVAFASDFNENGLILGKRLVIDLAQASGEGWTVTQLENGWVKVALDIEHAAITDEVVGVTKDFIKIMRMEFNNSTAETGVLSTVSIDNLSVEGAVATSVTLDEEKPWETKSPYVNYTVKFVNSDGSIISEEIYHYGDSVVVPESPTMSGMDKEGQFTFDGWDYEVTKVNGHATYKATYIGTILDLINCEIENGGIDGITYDKNLVNGESNRSLKISEPIASGNLPYFALTLDSAHDLSDKYIVFDFKKIDRSGWLMVFDFVTNEKLGLWTMLSISDTVNESTHKCEDLGNGWLRVYLNANAISNGNDITSVSKIYLTLNASDGEGVLDLYIDNLHFEELPEFTVTFKDYDGRVISSDSYKAGASVTEPKSPVREGSLNEATYEFAGWDYEVTAVNCDATYTAKYRIVNAKDLLNCEIENGGIDSLGVDTSVKNGESDYSLKISEPIASGNLPYFAIDLDKTYDLTNKYIVFDINFAKDGWLVGFDFVNDGAKNGLWNMHTIKSGETSTSHKCEELENGWLRVFVNAGALSSSISKVSKIYFTLNASDGEGTLEFNLDNLHFEEIPEVKTYFITFKNYDGSVISSQEYEEGATVTIPENPTRTDGANEVEYMFAGWDYEVTAVNCDATYTATYKVAKVKDLLNCEIENGGIDSLGVDTSVKNGESDYSLKISEPIASGNLPYFAIDLDKTYDLTNKYIVFDINFAKDGWLVGFDFVNDGAKNGLWNMHTIKSGETSTSHKCEELENGWLRVFVNAGALSSSISKVSKIYFTLNASDGEGTLEFNLDNLHFEDIPAIEEPETPNPEDPTVEVDRIEDCGLVAVNGGSFTKENGYAKATVPANNSGVWWNYDVDLTTLLGKGLNLSGKTITYDVKIVGNMSWVGFTVCDGLGNYFKPNDEDYAWMNLSNGWSGFDMAVTAVEDGWFRVSLAPSTTFASVKENVGKLRFLVNPQDENEASFLIDNMILGELVGYVEPAKTDKIEECGFVAVNGGTFAYDSTNGYAVATVPANNSGVWWNFDIGLIDITGEAVNLSGKTISFDVKIVGNMSWVGFTVGCGDDNYAQVNGEGYAWMNLSDKWSGYGMSINALEDGWFRVTVTMDESFSSASSNITKLRFLVNPQDANESTFSVDNLYL